MDSYLYIGHNEIGLKVYFIEYFYDLSWDVSQKGVVTICKYEIIKDINLKNLHLYFSAYCFT